MTGDFNAVSKPQGTYEKKSWCKYLKTTGEQNLASFSHIEIKKALSCVEGKQFYVLLMKNVRSHFFLVKIKIG